MGRAARNYSMLWMFIGTAGIISVFLFQDFQFLDGWPLSETQLFVVKKVLRVTLNDLFMLLVIMGWFHDKQITRLALFVQLIDGLILLPLYLLIKVATEGPGEISTPLLSQFHRIIINPTLMILLIAGVYFQRYQK